MESLYLPRFTCGQDAYDNFDVILNEYGNKCALIYGEKAYKASKDALLSALDKAHIEVTSQQLYGHNATFENVDRLCEIDGVKAADYILAIGGGKCIDTVKCVGEKIGKPVFSCPTIGSNCAPVTKISIMYYETGEFREIVQLKQPPVHCFINTNVVVNAPEEYYWAGIGDTMAKHIESLFSARGDILPYSAELGVKAGELCYYDVIKNGIKAYKDACAHKTSFEFEKVLLDIIISTGVVSVSVGVDYNSALAHALYYGLTVRNDVAEKHLHGEIVSYGTLVQLMMDKQDEMLKKTWLFNKELNLPTKLKDLGLDVNEDLSDILHVTEINQELIHVPYPVKAPLILESIKKLETYNGEDQ